MVWWRRRARRYQRHDTPPCFALRDSLPTQRQETTVGWFSRSYFSPSRPFHSIEFSFSAFWCWFHQLELKFDCLVAIINFWCVPLPLPVGRATRINRSDTTVAIIDWCSSCKTRQQLCSSSLLVSSLLVPVIKQDTLNQSFHCLPPLPSIAMLDYYWLIIRSFLLLVGNMRILLHSIVLHNNWQLAIGNGHGLPVSTLFHFPPLQFIHLSFFLISPPPPTAHRPLPTVLRPYANIHLSISIISIKCVVNNAHRNNNNNNSCGA